MSFAKDCILTGIVLVGIPSIGGVTAIAAAQVASRYGHAFTQFGPKNPYLIAAIGIIQNLASVVLLARFKPAAEDKLKTLAVIQICVGVALLALTALAARIQLIAARLTPAGVGMLIATGFLGTAGLIKLCKFIGRGRE